jgi:hydrogenase-4 transcriptional activator
LTPKDCLIGTNNCRRLGSGKRVSKVSGQPLRDNRAQDAVAAGQAALEGSRYEEASDHFKAALRAGVRSSEQEARVRCQLSVSLEKRGLYREALDAIVKYDNLPEFVRLSDRSQMGVLIRLGWSYSFSNDIPRAIALFNQAIEIARRLGDDAGIGDCYFGLGRAYRNFNEVRIASDQYTSALEHYRRVGEWRKLAESYISIGQINALVGDYRAALQSVKQALAIIGDHEEHNLRGRAYMYMAVTYDHMGFTNKALDAWNKSIEHFREARNTPFLAMNYNNLADKLIYLGEWSRAEELLKSAIEMLRATTLVASLGGALDTLAQLYVLRGRIDEADRLLEESRQILSSIKSGEWVEVSTLTTTGRRHLMKGQPREAIEMLARAVEICERSGDNHYIAEAQLWLAEAWLRLGKISQARALVESVKSYLSKAAQTKWWGLMMRMAAKIEAIEGHIASAIQLLGQSTSVFEIKGSVYDCAVNRVTLAEMLEKQGRVAEAITEVRAGLATFERLGASIDEENARRHVERLRLKEGAAPPCKSEGDADTPLPSSHMVGHAGRVPDPLTPPDAPARAGLASVIDGFIARRLVQASILRELLLRELVSIVQEQAAGRAAAVAELEGHGLRLASSVGLDEKEKADEIQFLSRLTPDDYRENFVFPFNDGHRGSYLLHIISPRAERFLSSAMSLQPLLELVELCLEAESQRSKGRRTQVFDPARLLAQVELPGFVCASRAMSLVLEQIYKIRSSDVTVLITGESGTGKELIARAVHAGSSRRFNTFLPFNCSAAPRDMVESQLFGYRKGAFTGAIASNEGIVRAAERGTLFLDEVGDLPLELQPKLLRFLQEGEIHPIGESQPLKVDVRVVAATNSELERAVSEGRFREDLFHRLNVIRIHVPQLRQRREEIPALINHYLTQYQAEASKSEVRLSEEVVDLMVVYDWPGNVRQLCNEVRRIVAYSDSGQIVTPDLLSPEIVRASREAEFDLPSQVKASELSPGSTEAKTIAEAVEELERRMIQDALRRSSGNIARAAKELGLTRRGLYMKMDRLNFRD